MRHLKYAMMAATLTTFTTTLLIAGTYEISWHTIDGGGATAPGESIGGDYALSGTIGQHDASSFVAPTTGGDYEVIGGFWAAAAVSCACLGDMNGDGLKNGADIQKFVDCVIAGESCSCADVDTMNGVTIEDTVAFVDDLLAEIPCP